MSVDGPGREQLKTLSKRLKEAGYEGQGLRRELRKQITEAAKPLARKIGSAEYLKPYLPDRYAEVLATDLSVKTKQSFSGDPGVQIRAVARQHKRKLVYLNAGFINHPVYAQGLRATWNWKNGQTGGMKAGFFTDACEEAAPDIRDRVLQAMSETAARITY